MRSRLSMLIGGLLFVVTGLAQQPLPTTWQLKGARLQVDSERIVYEAKNSAEVTIPTKAVSGVCYDTAIHARGPSAWEATKAMGGGAGGEGLVLAPVVLPVVAGIHASKSTRHFIILHWTPAESGDDPVTTLTLEAEKGNYAGLLKDLQRLSGKPWIDVSKHRREVYARLGDELKSAEKEKHVPYLMMKQRSRVGSSILDPYSYHAVLRAGSSGEGNLYLFSGVKEMHLAAVVHVSIKDGQSSDSDALPIYDSQTDPLPQVKEIRMPTEILIVSPSQPYDYDPFCPSLP